jgi:hypothetical protein
MMDSLAEEIVAAESRTRDAATVLNGEGENAFFERSEVGFSTALAATPTAA